MLAESLAHLHLTLSFPLPWALLLAVRRYRGRLARRRFVGWLAVVLVVQVLCSTEAALMLAVMACAGAVAWLVFADPEARDRIGTVLVESVGASAIAAVVLSPYLWYAFKDVRPDSIRSPYLFSGDALNLMIPTDVTRLGHQASAGRRPVRGERSRGGPLPVGLPIVVARLPLRPAGAGERAEAQPAGLLRHRAAVHARPEPADPQASRRSSCRGARP